MSKQIIIIYEFEAKIQGFSLKELVKDIVTMGENLGK
jgi:hypothetical protein